MIIVSIITVLLSLLSIQSLKEQDTSIEDGYSKENMNAVKGIMAICVVMSHLAAVVDYELPIYSFKSMGYMGVACFFLFSGYGLMISCDTNEYFNRFLYKRAVKILIPYVFLLLLYGVIINLFFGEPISDIAQSFLGGYPISNSWYVFGCLFCYFLFWLAFHITETRIKHWIVMLSGLVLYFLVMRFVLGWGDWWYKTIISFPIGILWGGGKA